MKPTKKPIPYAERLARESVKFGLRVGGTLLRRGPGLLKAGLFGLPIALMGGVAGRGNREHADMSSYADEEHQIRGDLSYDSHGELLSPLTEKELDDYNHGRI